MGNNLDGNFLTVSLAGPELVTEISEMELHLIPLSVKLLRFELLTLEHLVKRGSNHHPHP